MENQQMSCGRGSANEGLGGTRCLSTVALFAGLFLMLVAALPMVANAAEAPEAPRESGGWKFGVDAYLWMASIGGETAGGDSIDVPFDDLIKKLDLGFMGTFHAVHGPWHISTDLLYMQLSQDNHGQVSVPDVGTLKADAKVKVDAWVVTPAVGYTLIDTERGRLEVFTGVRYLYLDAELDLKVTGSAGDVSVRKTKSISESGDVIDGIVGVRGDVNLSKRWFVPYGMDVGTGESTFTWQAIAGVGYRISDAMDVVAAYRYLYWKFDDNQMLDSLDISGPMIGLRYRF